MRPSGDLNGIEKKKEREREINTLATHFCVKDVRTNRDRLVQGTMHCDLISLALPLSLCPSLSLSLRLCFAFDEIANTQWIRYNVVCLMLISLLWLCWNRSLLIKAHWFECPRHAADNDEWNVEEREKTTRCYFDTNRLSVCVWLRICKRYFLSLSLSLTSIAHWAYSPMFGIDLFCVFIWVFACTLIFFSFHSSASSVIEYCGCMWILH